jgi:hypothetical protein
LKEKSNLGLFGWDSSLQMNIKTVGNSPRLLIQPHLTNGLEVT